MLVMYDVWRVYRFFRYLTNYGNASFYGISWEETRKIVKFLQYDAVVSFIFKTMQGATMHDLAGLLYLKYLNIILNAKSSKP